MRFWCKLFHHLKVRRSTLLGSPYNLCLQCGRTYSDSGRFLTRVRCEQLIR